MEKGEGDEESEEDSIMVAFEARNLSECKKCEVRSAAEIIKENDKGS